MVNVINSGQPITGTGNDDLILGNPVTTGTATNTLNGGGGDDAIIGDIGAINVLADSLHNGTLAAAFNLDTNTDAWSYDENTLITSSTTVAHSTTMVNASDGESEYFSVTVGAGQTITADLDFGYGSAVGGIPYYAYVDILDSGGNVLASTYYYPQDPGSFLSEALTSYTAGAAGTYYIRVQPYGSGTYFAAGQSFMLNTSVSGHTTGISNAVGGDTINGNDGNDALYGVAGDDTIAGGAGNDTLDGGSGDDTLSGGDGNDTLYPGTGTIDVLHGNAGDDFLHASSSGSFFGDDGNDTLIVDAASTTQTADGGSGIDTVDLSSFGSTVTVDLAAGTSSLTGLSLAHFENATTGSGNDSLSGTTGNNVLSGGYGDDGLFGGAGSDTLVGGQGNDTLTGGTDAGHTDIDYASYAYAQDDVTVSLATTAAQDTGGDGTDTLTGIEGLIGGYYDDTLTGNDDANWFHGGGGTNTISGGGGNDTFVYDNNDTANQDVLDGGDGDDTLDLSGTLLGWSINILNPGSSVSIVNMNTGASIDSLTSIEHVLGSNTADIVLTGGTSAGFTPISVNAGGGNDAVTVVFGGGVVDGGAGVDTIDIGLDSLDYATSIANSGAYVFFDTYTLDMASGKTSIAGESLKNFENVAFIDPMTLLGDVDVTTDFTIKGTTRANDIVLGAGDDTIDGRGGGDHMAGGTGDDTYVVYSQADLVEEAAGGGSDTIKAVATYVLASGVSVEALQTTSASGTGAINLTGNELGQTITGNKGSNKLYGMGGADKLIGGAGNDRLDGGSGTDSARYSDSGSAVTVSLAVTAAQNTGGGGTDTLVSIENLIGSDYDDALTGNAGNNSLWGSYGSDKLIGGAGNDLLDGGNGVDSARYSDATAAVTVNLSTSAAQNTGGAGTDTLVSIENVIGSTHNDKLTGSSEDNTLWGSDGNDTIDGGLGVDTLDGGAGQDTFRFTTTLGAANVDTISGFVVADDTIGLGHSVFAGLSVGALGGSAFYKGSAAHDSSDRIIYNAATGALLFDRDGNGSTYSAVQFATIAKNLAITAADFTVI